MATQKKIIGKLPVFRGEYNKDVVYYKHNIVTYLGSSFISTKDENMSVPCAVGDKEFILSSGWAFFSDSSEAYFMDERFDEMAEVVVTTDDEGEVNNVEPDVVNEAIRKTPQILSKAEQAQARANISAASLEENAAFKKEVTESNEAFKTEIDAKVSDIGSEVDSVTISSIFNEGILRADGKTVDYKNIDGYLNTKYLVAKKGLVINEVHAYKVVKDNDGNLIYGWLYDESYNLIALLKTDSNEKSIPVVLTDIPDNAKFVRFNAYRDELKGTSLCFVAESERLYDVEQESKENKANISTLASEVNTANENLNTIKDNLGIVFENISDQIEYETTNGYIKVDGNIIEFERYTYSKVFLLNKGYTIKIEALGKTAGSISMLSKWNNDGTIFIANLHTSESDNIETFEHKAEEDEYLRICYYSWQNQEKPIVEKISESALEKIQGVSVELEEIDKEQKRLLESYWQYSIDRILCIGDSLTQGVLTNTGNTLAQNYPYQMSRMLNARVENAGYAGRSASDIYNTYMSRHNIADSNVFIIWLGTNNGLTDTLDSDVNAYDKYEDYALTETGYYCKIIESIFEQKGKDDCLIVLTKIFASKGDYIVTNKVIDKIAEKYGLLVVDNSDLGKNARPDLRNGVSDTHFSKAGYTLIAKRYIDKITEYITGDITRCEFGFDVIVESDVPNMNRIYHSY